MTSIPAIRTILVPLDGSETGQRALPWAKALAGKNANIILLEVTPVAVTIRAFGGQVIGSAEKVQEGFRQIAQQQLDEAAARFFTSDDKITTVIAMGDPTEQIIATALEHNADLIVMSSHGRGAIGRFVSGSVADRIVRHAPLPVMIIGPEGEITPDAVIERIIVPIEDTDLSRAAIPVAAGIAKLVNAPISVVHVILPVTDLAFTYPGAFGTLPPSAFDGTFEQIVADANAFVGGIVTTLKNDGIEASGEVYNGSTAHSIIETLRPGDVIVLSSHARQGLARWVIGSTTTKLIRNGLAPVVVVTRESIEHAAETADPA